jgi:hypothetical protein
VNKEELLRIMRLLSALEAVGLYREPAFPSYLIEQIDDAVVILEREILK